MKKLLLAVSAGALASSMLVSTADAGGMSKFGYYSNQMGGGGKQMKVICGRGGCRDNPNYGKSKSR